MIIQDSGLGKYYLSAELNIENVFITLTLDESFFVNPYHYTNVYHNHTKHEFFFVKRGECEIYIDGVFYNLFPDSFILIPAGMNHRVCSASIDAEIYPVKLLFCRNKTKRDITDTDVFVLLTSLISESKPVIFRECSRIFEEIGKLTAIFAEKKKLYLERLDAVAICFMIAVICFMEDLSKKNNVDGLSNKYRGTQSYADIIDGYFNTFYGKDITLSGLAEHLQLSVTHTQRLLRKIYGMGFVGLLRKTRITVAKDIFLERNLPFETIAEMVGYSSYKGFTYAFRKITGQTPSKFKKSNKFSNKANNANSK